ncbi:tripartite tricarboxylate transporter TctB family protein, partial [Acinetobacter venetianus]|uniref:tripartite tricarboxylate transporter TctB family protein n=1 Tax=Acinetobacter venetianus TaxID=52133 RepID=UPI003A911131
MSNKKSHWDGLTGIFSMAFGLIYGFYAYNLPQPMFGNPLEAMFMPLAISIVAMIIGFLLIIKVGVRKTIASLQKLISSTGENHSSKYKIIFSCVISILYALLFEHIGYVL